MTISTTMTRRWLDQLIADSGAIEVRMDRLGNRKYALNGWFDDGGKVLDLISEYPQCNAITTINRVRGILPTNQMIGGKYIGNEDITHVTRLFFDFDPEVPAGVPATETELARAKRKAAEFRQEMSGRGWPEPALGISGNGAHLMYRAEIGRLEDFMPIWTRLYKMLCDKYSDESVKLDPSVKNVARLTRLYGTTNRKGEATPDRPHRVTSIWVPEQYRKIDNRKLFKTMQDYGADKQPERVRFTPPQSGSVSGAGDYRTLDVVSWFQAKGLYLEHGRDNRHHVVCPWSHEHTTESIAGGVCIWEGDGSGWPQFHCKHGHCSHRRINDVMELFGDADDFCAQEFRRAQR